MPEIQGFYPVDSVLMDSRLPFGQFILSGWLASQPKGGNDPFGR
jgi:hypothetical protein